MMAEPSTQAIRTALSRSYASSIRGGGRRPPVTLSDVLDVLAADLRTPGDQRTRPPLPRAVVGLALWNLTARYFDGPRALAADQASVRRLDRLVTEVFGWNLAELAVMRQQPPGPLRSIARQYRLLDYRWTPPRESKGTLSAALEVLVPAPLEHVRAVVEPSLWRDACELFWSDVVPRNARRFAERGTQRTVWFDAALGLPELAIGRPPLVRARCTVAALPNGRINAFAMSVAGADGRGAAVFCDGSIRAEKERGGPWMTRIRHEKRLLFRAGAAGDLAADLLSYWIQAETACLVAAF